MVMHARKLPRISDGFSEKHQTHGYETQAKYPSNKYRFNHEKGQRDSPSSNSVRRSSSPESRSQSPRFHKNNYFKVRDKERDRERDREYKDYRERTGVFMCEGSRSPKDRRREIRNRDRERDRERDHRESRVGIHERLNSGHKKEEKERLMRVGEWSEHVSSSGKKYYYNCRSEVSQWEKPQEWLEWERTHPRSGHSNKEVPPHPLQRVHSEKSRPDKHSSLNDGYRESRDLRECDRSERDRREYRNDEHYSDRRDGRKYGQVPQSADMDISSGNSTPTSESHHGRLGGEGPEGGQTHLGHNQFSRPMKAGSIGQNNQMSTNNNHCGASSSSSQIMSASTHLLNTHPRLMGLGHNNDQKNSDDPEQHSMLPHHGLLQAASNNHGHPSSSQSTGHLGGYVTTTLSSSDRGPKSHLEPLSIIPTNNLGGAGPPTPTHSENQEGLDIRKGSPNSSLNSLHSLSVAASNTPSLTPSLANYYDDRLISHVNNWPADNLEKQSQRLNEEAHSLGSLLMTKVSADLKMARSLVRLSEIQATLHEQRILFLRAQKRELDEVKPQNCYINDS